MKTSANIDDDPVARSYNGPVKDVYHTRSAKGKWMKIKTQGTKRKQNKIHEERKNVRRSSSEFASRIALYI